MSKYTSKELDKALAMLNKNGNLTPIQYVSEDEKARLDGIFRHLKALGLVELKEAGCIYGVLLLNKGLVFINDGGFKNAEQKEKKESELKKSQKKNLELSNEKLVFDKRIRKWKMVALILTILSYLAGYYNILAKIIALFRGVVS